jgi:hypothetical protein
VWFRPVIYTRGKMFLSDLRVFSHSVQRNARFDTVGSLYSNTQNRIVALTNIQELELLKTKKEITGVIITPN